MTALTLPLAGFFTALTVLLFAVSARRLLGLRFSYVRMLVAGLIAFLLAPEIVTAMAGEAFNDGSDQAYTPPGLWFVLLGVVIALVIGMVFLVVAEALVPSGSLPGPLYVIQGMRSRLHRMRRYSQITRIVVRHGLAPYLRGGRRAELATTVGRARFARSLRLALDDGGVTFTKLGQVFSTRRDLLPAEFIDELSRLQDHAAELPWAEVEQVLRSELAADVSEVFAAFEHAPMAAASVAQVHAAVLKSGERVVVKVLRPGVETVVDWDLDIVARLALNLERGTRWGRQMGTVALARGFADALREELDLRIEVRNMVAVAAATSAAGGGSPAVVQVPTPYQPLCTKRVLVMQRLDGVPVAEVAGAEESLGAGDRVGVGDEAGVDTDALARALLNSLLSQVLLTGVFHADPHPGNILLTVDHRIGLLDFGSVGRIDAGLRASLQRLLLAVDRGDPTGLTDALLEVVDRPELLDEQRLQRALGRFLVRHVGPGLTPDVRMFGDLVRLVADHGLAVPPEIAAVFRALATLEGTLTQLAPGFDIVIEARGFASRQFGEQLRPDALRRAATDELTAMLPMLRRLPRRLDRIGADLESGNLRLNVRLLADEEDRLLITGLLHQVLITVLAATTGLMAVLMLGLRDGPALTETVGLFQFFGYCLLVVSAILALRILSVIFRSTNLRD